MPEQDGVLPLRVLFIIYYFFSTRDKALVMSGALKVSLSMSMFHIWSPLLIVSDVGGYFSPVPWFCFYFLLWFMILIKGIRRTLCQVPQKQNTAICYVSYLSCCPLYLLNLRWFSLYYTVSCRFLCHYMVLYRAFTHSPSLFYV